MKSKSHKHSPGPWSFRNGGIWSADGFLIAAINIEDNQHIQPKGFAKANGRLLAQAERLAANLNGLVACIRNFELGDYSPLMDEIFDSEAALKDAGVPLKKKARKAGR